MAYPFPSAAWTDALKEALNNNPDFAKAGCEWTHGSLALVVDADPSAGLEKGAAMMLDLEAGRCRCAAYLETSQVPEQAAYVVEADYDLWKEILEGKQDPTKALMQWKLRVTKGPLPTLIKHTPAFKRLILTAAALPTRFLK